MLTQKLTKVWISHITVSSQPPVDITAWQLTLWAQAVIQVNGIQANAAILTWLWLTLIEIYIAKWPPKPCSTCKKEKRKNKCYLNHFLPLVSLLSQLGSAWLCFHKQKMVFKACIDSQSLLRTGRLSSLDHLIMFNKSQPLLLWSITLNRPNTLIFFLNQSQSIHREAYETNNMHQHTHTYWHLPLKRRNIPVLKAYYCLS